MEGAVLWTMDRITSNSSPTGEARKGEGAGRRRCAERGARAGAGATNAWPPIRWPTC